jgi:Ca2+-binding EF-hand superfamily protein
MGFQENVLQESDFTKDQMAEFKDVFWVFHQTGDGKILYS